MAGQFLAGLRTRDWELLRSILLEDVVWSLPGTSVISGEAHGAGAVVHRAQTITSYGLSFALKHMLIGRGGVALSLHNTARRDELVFDEHLATVLSLHGGKVSAIDTYLSDIGMLNAFFVPR